MHQSFLSSCFPSSSVSINNLGFIRCKAFSFCSLIFFFRIHTNIMPQKHFVMNSSCFTRFSIFFCCVFTMATVIYKDSSKTSVGNCFAMYTHIASNFLAIKEALLGTCVRGWLSGQLAHFGRKILTRTGRARMKEGLQLASIKKNSLKEFLKVKKTRLNCFPKRLFHFFFSNTATNACVFSFFSSSPHSVFLH